jgi:SNF2 family DNA or RNA helicase
MDEKLKRVYEKLKEIRERKDLTLRPSPFLKETFTGFDGKEHPLKVRYYQIQGILHLVAMKRFLLGDDTGLGKTLQTIVALCYIWDKNPDTKVIILTNKSAVAQWANEFNKFTNNIKTIVSSGTPPKRRKARGQFETATGPTVLIMGYRSAVGDFSEMQNWKDYILVTDEATAYKNTKTQVHQVCRHLSENASRTWGLTATLIKNNLMEGHGIYSVVVPGLFGSKNGFMMQYCITQMQRIPGGRRQIPVIVGYRNSAIEQFRAEIDPFFIGRPKFEVASELPALTTREIKVGMNPSQAMKYAEALSGLLEVGHGDEVEEKEVTKLTSIIYCQEIVNHLGLIDCDGDSEKLDALVDLLKDGDLAGEKVIIFTRFRKMTDIAMPVLESKKIKCVRISGAEDEMERKAAADAFQDPDSDAKVIFITMAGAEAVNLQAAKAIVFYDSPWSAGDYIQIIGRMIRIGSTHDNVYAIHLVCKGTVDQRVMDVLKKKMKLINAVIGKRIKGAEDEVIISSENEISDIFSSLQDDAREALI